MQTVQTLSQHVYGIWKGDSMAKILENREVGEDFFLMKVESENEAQMGQFYMLRAGDQ